MKCDYDGINDLCENEARYLLQYSVDLSLAEIDEHDPWVADFEQYCCEEHIFNLEFVHDPGYGLPERIFDYQEVERGEWRPDLVEKLVEMYEAAHGPY